MDRNVKWTGMWNGQECEMDRTVKWAGMWNGYECEMGRNVKWVGMWDEQECEMDRNVKCTGLWNGQKCEMVRNVKWVWTWNGQECKIRHYKRLENTSKFILDTKNETSNIPCDNTFCKLPATLPIGMPKCQAPQLIFPLDFRAFSASVAVHCI